MPSIFLVSSRTLIYELGIFFACGGISCVCTGLKVFVPIMRNIEPEGVADDLTYKWIALAGIALFILVKGKAIFWLRDREVDRILNLAPVIEIYTDQYYSSRLTFSASAIAVGIMLSAACVSTLFRLFSDKLLGVKDVELNRPDSFV